MKEKIKIELKDKSFEFEGVVHPLEGNKFEIITHADQHLPDFYQWLSALFNPADINKKIEEIDWSERKAKIVTEKFSVVGAWPQAVNFNDLDMTSHICIIEAVIHYDQKEDHEELFSR